MVYSSIVILIIVQFLGICFVIGTEQIYRTKQHHGLNDLVHDFSNIIQKPTAEFIDLNLDFEDAFDREASGVYKLIPYYMKIYPKDTNHGDRFIIQQNPFNGEFQLVKIFNYIYRKNVRSLFHPNKEIPQKKDLTTINSLYKCQTNVKALAEKNITLIEEIQKTKDKSKNFKQHLQNKEKNLHKDVEQEKRKMKEKKFKLKEEIFQLKLNNKENEQTIYDLQQTLEPKQALINAQKIMIEKLKIDLSQLKYENVWLKDENLNLTNQLKTTKENLNQEKDKNHKLQKQEKEMKKTNDENQQKKTVKMYKMHDEHLSKLSNPEETTGIKEKLIKTEKGKEKNKKLEQQQENQFQHSNKKIKAVTTEDHVSTLLHLEQKKKELGAYKKKSETFESYFEQYYYDFINDFPTTFMTLSLEHQFRFQKLSENEELEFDQKFAYEHCLIAYGLFKHVEQFRVTGMINIPKIKITENQMLIKKQVINIAKYHNVLFK